MYLNSLLVQTLYKFFLLFRFVSEVFGFSCSLPVFRTSLLYDGLGLLWEWIGFLGFLCLMVSFLDHNS